MANTRAYTPVLAKHSKHFSLEDSLAIGVDRMQRNSGLLKQQVEEWPAMQLSTSAAKLLIYQAFIQEGNRVANFLHEEKAAVREIRSGAGAIVAQNPALPYVSINLEGGAPDPPFFGRGGSFRENEALTLTERPD